MDAKRKHKRKVQPKYQLVMAKPPTMRELQHMAAVVLRLLGGVRSAADKMTMDSFYTLAYLAALRVDGPDGEKSL